MNDAFGIIVVGDEILNGRRQDRHFEAIGGLLRERGFAVAWLRILPDDPECLVTEFSRSMADGIPVFCCGGIGATPDDHTRACAARAAGVPLGMHPGAVAEIEARFPIGKLRPLMAGKPRAQGEDGNTPFVQRIPGALFCSIF